MDKKGFLEKLLTSIYTYTLIYIRKRETARDRERERGKMGESGGIATYGYQ